MPQENLKKKRLLFAILAIIIIVLILIAVILFKEIFTNIEYLKVSTDKSEYKTGKEVKVFVQNISKEVVSFDNLYSLSDREDTQPYFDIEKLENNEWKYVAVSNSSCFCGGGWCSVAVQSPFLYSGEKVEYKWDQYQGNCKMESFREQVLPGKYRAITKIKTSQKLSEWLGLKDKTKEIYYAEFLIK